jgi:hypothetical protein
MNLRYVVFSQPSPPWARVPASPGYAICDCSRLKPPPFYGYMQVAFSRDYAIANQIADMLNAADGAPKPQDERDNWWTTRIDPYDDRIRNLERFVHGLENACKPLCKVDESAPVSMFHKPQAG